MQFPSSVFLPIVCLKLKDKLFIDGNIVNLDGGINVIKIAVHYVWQLDKISKKIRTTNA